MRVQSDLDIVVLLAVALSSKRRPAELAEIMAAVSLTPGALAAEFKLTESLQRLSAHGLIVAQGNGIELTAAGQQIVGAQPRKAATAELRIQRVKDSLADYHASGDDEPMSIHVDEVRAAIQAHRSHLRIPGKDYLLPKPPADPDRKAEQRKGPWRASNARRKAHSR